MLCFRGKVFLKIVKMTLQDIRFRNELSLLTRQQVALRTKIYPVLLFLGLALHHGIGYGWVLEYIGFWVEI